MPAPAHAAEPSRPDSSGRFAPPKRFAAPLPPPEPGRWRRCGRFVRRHVGWLIAVAVLALVACAGWTVAARERRRADDAEARGAAYVTLSETIERRRAADDLDFRRTSAGPLLLGLMARKWIAAERPYLALAADAGVNAGDQYLTLDAVLLGRGDERSVLIAARDIHTELREVFGDPGRAPRITVRLHRWTSTSRTAWFPVFQVDGAAGEPFTRARRVWLDSNRLNARVDLVD